MSSVYNLYMDDSGTRHPDHCFKDTGKPDWFGLGGIVVRQEDEEACRDLHAKLCKNWEIKAPLHSEEIRYKKKNFRWLRDEKVRQTFLTELERMLLSVPALGIACVIDRVGYHTRYHEQYGSSKWSLCKSAFTICVERASKLAQREGRKLNVYVERSDRKTDEQIRSYFADLKVSGHPFNVSTASKYAPLAQGDLAAILHDFKLKNKSSPMMQVADLYLYPICQGGYNPSYYPFERLEKAERLIDCRVENPVQEGIKYYCFEQVHKEH